MFHHSHSRYIRSKKYSALSYKGIFRTLYYLTLRTLFPNLVTGLSTMFPVAKDVTTNFFHRHMRRNKSRNRISTTIRVFLGRKKEKTGRNPSASNISLCISLLLVISVETILRGISVWSFLTPDTLVFLRKYSASVGLTAWNDRDRGKEVKSIRRERVYIMRTRRMLPWNNIE